MRALRPGHLSVCKPRRPHYVRAHSCTLSDSCGVTADVVKHKFLNFRGVIFDLDPTFNNTEEWYNSIPKDFRPKKEQPFYHLFAENEEIFYIAYVSEQNLNIDNSGIPANHPDIKKIFSRFNGTSYVPYDKAKN